MRYLIILNALEHNRGSEALIRGLVEIICQDDRDASIAVAAGNSYNTTTKIDNVRAIVPRFQKNKCFSAVDRICRLITRNSSFVSSLHFRQLIKQVRNADVVIVIGADNYDASYHMAPIMAQINTLVFDNLHGSAFLLDCSFNAGDFDERVINDLRRFKTITVRESESRNNIAQWSIDLNIKLYPDPAFVMEPKECVLPSIFESGNVVGVNLSNILLKGDHDGSILRNYTELIRYILDCTDYSVLLIPHVMNGLDFGALSTLLQECVRIGLDLSDRVFLWDNEAYAAHELKYAISKLTALVTARTHASIAGYSCGIPTLVIGYSTKSTGIARDIFGVTDGYVLNAHALKADDDIVRAFQALLQNKAQIKEHLSAIMPDYIRDAASVGRLLTGGSR